MLLPITKIVEELRRVGVRPFVLVDAAQALSHVDLGNLSGIADFLVTGTHKWVGSYFPLGVGIACNPYSQTWISNCIRSMVSAASVDDGLLRFWHSSLGGLVVLLATLQLWQDWNLSDHDLAQHGQ